MSKTSFTEFFDSSDPEVNENDELSLISFLQKCSYSYYTEGETPIVSDSEYDRLYDIAKDKWPDNPFFSNVGIEPISKHKVNHDYILGSLTKFKDENIQDFLEPLDKNGWIYILPKYDGLSIYAEFNKGKLVKAATRGNGAVGVNITEKAKYFCEVPTDKHVKLRGEILLSGSDHEELGFVNRRNGASGLIGQKYFDPEQLKMLKVVWYEVLWPEMSLEKSLDLLQAYNQKIKVENFSEPDKIFQDIKNEFSDLDLDGLVLIYDSDDEPYIRQNEYYPTNKVCWKPVTERADTVVKEVTWSTTRTGRVVPVAIFEYPVMLDGTQVSKATCYNAKWVLDNKLQPGSKVQVQKSNFIIPKILKVY